MPVKAVAEATRRARSTGRSVAITVPNEALPAIGNIFNEAMPALAGSPLSHTLGNKESHRQRMAASTNEQISDNADMVTGDGARAKKQRSLF